MSWFFERRQIPSQINGSIQCTRLFGKWEALVGTTSQASTYLDQMWRQALKRLPVDLEVHRILVIGLGLGRSLPIFRKRFPRAHLTVVEIDPKMVELAREMGPLSSLTNIDLRVGDAVDVLPQLSGPFELVISDAFLGDQIGPSTTQQDYLEQLKRLTFRQGVILVNAFHQPEVLSLYRALFFESSRWIFRLNTVALFRPHGAGELGDILPKGYVRFPTCPAYIEREYGAFSSYRVVQSGDLRGIRVPFGLFLIDIYYGDQEPVVYPESRSRLVLWNATSRTMPPQGWGKWLIPGDRRKTGFTILPLEGPVHLGWSELAQRKLKQWHKQQAYVLVDVELEEWATEYRKSGQKPRLIDLFIRTLRRRMDSHRGLIRLFGVREVATGELISGFASMDIPEIQQSMHVTSFNSEKGRKTPAGSAMIEHWFLTARDRGIRFCDFDGFWAPGDPASWKGYSAYKAQFDVWFVRYPKPFWKWVGRPSPSQGDYRGSSV